MKIDLSNRQKEILKALRTSCGVADRPMFEMLEEGHVDLKDIDRLCEAINNEYMLSGLLPTFEPNSYGLELEELLDTINRPRLKFHNR